MALLALWVAPVALPAQGVGCLAVEHLSVRERGIAEAMLLAAGDGEALYTLAGGLKPVSSDFLTVVVTVAPDTDHVALDSLARVRRVAEALGCGELEFHVGQFAQTFVRTDSSAYVVAAVYAVHRGALRDVIQRFATFFATLDITAETPVPTVLARVERAAREPRWRAYGYLFGYPAAAVDFFVAAGASQDSTGRFVPRDFRRIETYRKFPVREGEPPTLSSFVYAVPKDAPESPADRALREAAAPIFGRYVNAREEYQTDGRVDTLALWRAWLMPPARP